MSGIPDNKKRALGKARAIVARTFTELSNTADKSLQIVIRELQSCCADLIRALNEQQQLQAASRILDIDGFPGHGTRCELFDGQYTRLTQTAASPQIVSVDHGLRRVPQGAVFIKSSNSNNQILIPGDKATNTPPADELRVSFRLNGSVNDVHICILF